MDVTEEITEEKLSIKTIDEDEFPIVYVGSEELNEDFECKRNLNIPRSIITTEDDFNLNGFIFESDIKVEEPEYPEYAPSAESRCHADVIGCEENGTLKKLFIKIERISAQTIEEYTKRTRKRQFECDICGSIFQEKEYLKNHMVTHMQKKFVCSDCPKKFSTLRYLENHRRLHGEGAFVCEICYKKYPHKDSLKYHLKLHIGEKTFECDYCPMKFLVAHQLRIHRRRHTGARPYKCTKCKKQFAAFGTWQSHVKTVHSDERPFTCDYNQCPQTFKTQSGLGRHKRRHLPNKNAIACKDCPKKFVDTWRFKVHQRIHKGERPHTCEFCSKTFTEKSVLDNHRRMHTKEKPFACTECPNTFSRLSTLIDHRRVHSDVRNYGCDICEKTFKSKTILRAHKQMHSEKKFACDRCSTKFRMEKSWKDHQRNGADLIKCKLCNYSINWMCEFKEHVKTHVGEKRINCTVCSKVFVSISLLNKHAKTHLEEHERQHGCSHCSRRFVTTPSLKRHMLTHTGEKPFKCKKCSNTFAREDSLRSHMGRIHFKPLECKEKKQQKLTEFECYICRFRCIGSKREMEKHIKKH